MQIELNKKTSRLDSADNRVREIKRKASDELDYGLSFFGTSGGLVGCAHYAKVGDHVCFSFNRGTPVILRERGKGKFEWIGGCYVPGLNLINGVALGDRGGEGERLEKFELI